jgi:pSer/pThr/pTyr-binding forkhead associated (FHA) protein
MWILRTPESDPDPLTFRMAAGAIKTIGRAQGVDFVLDAALVSRVHCRLEAGDADIQVVDLSSTNGTFVNDKRIERAKAVIGDRVRVGRVELTIAQD